MRRCQNRRGKIKKPDVLLRDGKNIFFIRNFPSTMGIFKQIEDCPKPPPSFLPTEAWQKEKTEDFKKLQLFLKSKLPSDPTNDTVHVSHWEGKILTQTPKFDDLCDLTQLAKTKILKVILDCLEKIPEGESFCYETGVWLYGLLATLEMPLHPDTHHLIRSIARKCACIRACLGHDSPEEVYVPLNLIICVVGRGFGQYDLAD